MAAINRQDAFKSRPILVFWETTRACLLSCQHCRASAQPTPLPGQLSTDEGIGLLEKIKEFGEPLPVIIFTGGDPLMRSDIFELLQYARTLGLRTAISPSVTDLLTEKILERFKACGVGAISISIDGSTSRTHDRIRGVQGTFDKSLILLREAVRLGLNAQVNTTVMQRNLMELADLFHLVKEYGVKNWEVFFLIRTGRALDDMDLSPMQYEDACNFLYDASRYLIVRTVEAPFIRRIALQQNGNAALPNTPLYQNLRSRLIQLEGPSEKSPSIRPFGTLDGDGIVFVGFDGEVFPGGLLPIHLGNIRKENIVHLYRSNSLMVEIRNRKFSGKCGSCRYKNNCGGSRARAYAYCGDPLESDPACPYSDVVPTM